MHCGVEQLRGPISHFKTWFWLNDFELKSAAVCAHIILTAAISRLFYFTYPPAAVFTVNKIYSKNGKMYVTLFEVKGLKSVA